MTAEQQLQLIDQLKLEIETRRITLSALGVQTLDGATEEGALRSSLSEINQLVQHVAGILRHDGPVRTLPITAQKIMDNLAALLNT